MSAMNGKGYLFKLSSRVFKAGEIVLKFLCHDIATVDCPGLVFYITHFRTQTTDE